MINYRSKRTRALLGKDEESQASKKTASHIQVEPLETPCGVTGERWGPFQPDKPAKNSSGSNCTPANGHQFKSQKFKEPSKGGNRVTQRVLPVTNHRVHSSQTASFSKLDTQMLESEFGANPRCQFGIDQPLKATKSALIWKNQVLERPSPKPSLVDHERSGNNCTPAEAHQFKSQKFREASKGGNPVPRRFPPMTNYRVHSSQTTPSSKIDTQMLESEFGADSPCQFDIDQPLKKTNSAPIWKNQLLEDENRNLKTSEILSPRYPQTSDFNPKNHPSKTPNSLPNEVAMELEESSNISKPFNPRRRSLTSDWSDKLKFDENEKVLTIDSKGNYELVSGSIQPHDVWHSPNVKYFVTFNEFYQPIKKGGHILMRFIGDVARTEQYCPIRETNWHHVNEQYKIDIVELIRVSKIPNGEDALE